MPSKKPRESAPQIDEFGARGGMPAVVPGPDRSVEKGGASTAIHEVSWSQFDVLVQSLARAARTACKPDAVVGLVHGGVFVGGAIARVLQVPFHPLKVAIRSRDHRAAPAPDGFLAELEGARVLVVDDVASSGDSFERALAMTRAAGLKKVYTAALVARPGGYQPQVIGLVSTETFVFPWDYAPLVDDTRFTPSDRPATPARGRARVTRRRRGAKA